MFFARLGGAPWTQPMQTQPTRTDASFASRPVPLRFREVGGRMLITNYDGSWLILSKDEFQALRNDKIPAGGALEAKLAERNFLRDAYNQAKAVEKLRARKSFVGTGPNLHVFVVTLRCNQTCVYCHSSRAPMNATHTDMSRETAERSIDLVLNSTSPSVTIEFQGGEPLVVFPLIQHIVKTAIEKNKAVGKTLEFTLVSNLTMMDEEKLAFLLDHRVQICTSIDGPRDLHDRQRKLRSISSFSVATQWIRRINEAYAERGLDPSLYRVEALLTTTRDTLPLWKEVVDTYVELGCRAMFLRPLDPFGFADRTGPRIEYPREDFMEFYRNAVDYMLELNAQGVQVLERFAGIFLTKILGGVDPNYLDIRNPCGAGIGQIAYDADGQIYTCDEGRMLGAMGDASFRIGDVKTSSYRELIGHETVRAIALASNLDAQPDCVNCAYNPYCGVCPVHNHKSQGNIFGRMRESALCAVYGGIQDYLFEKIGEGNPTTLETFKRWTTIRERSHFLQKPE